MFVIFIVQLSSQFKFIAFFLYSFGAIVICLNFIALSNSVVLFYSLVPSSFEWFYFIFFVIPFIV